MRYIYIVTRTVKGEKSGTSVPNLGVHTNKTRALKHFNGVVEDRVKIGYEIVYSWWNPETNYPDDLPHFEMKTALMLSGDVQETLRLERWKVK
jgi:hypothetical protein